MLARFRVDSGSIPLVILASIVIGGLVIALVSRTVSGQQQVRFDRQYQTAINGADAGVQQALNVLSELPPDDERVMIDSTGLDTTLGNKDFDWVANRTLTGDWEISATGREGDIQRKLEVLATQEPEFFVAAFGRVGVRMVGNNEVLSYKAGAVNTGVGAVGSNGSVSIIGNSSADVVMLWGAEATCTSSFNPSALTCNDNPIEGYPTKLDFPSLIADVETEMNAECAPEDFEPYDRTKHEPLQADTVYCFTTMTTPNHASVTVAGGATQNTPATVFVKPGPIQFGNHNEINCGSGCNFAGGQTPESGRLQIYTTTENFQVGTQSKIAAAIMAPAATCRGNPSSAQADIFGSLICHQIGNDGSGNQGGWSFYFDENLTDIGGGRFLISEFREEGPGTSSF